MGFSNGCRGAANSVDRVGVMRSNYVQRMNWLRSVGTLGPPETARVDFKFLSNITNTRGITGDHKKTGVGRALPASRLQGRSRGEEEGAVQNRYHRGKGPLSETSVSNPSAFSRSPKRRGIGCSSDVTACRVDSLANESAKQKTRKKGAQAGGGGGREGARGNRRGGRREKGREAGQRKRAPAGRAGDEDGQKGRLKTSIVTAASKL